MNYALSILQEAEFELNEAAIWYETKQEKLGFRFIDTTLRHLEHIQSNPRHYEKKHKEYREALVPGFPFIIVYRIDREQHKIIVVAIFHTSRNPKHKYNREK